MKLARAILLPLVLTTFASCGSGSDSTGGVTYPPGEQPYDAGMLPPITNYITDVKSGDGTMHAALVTERPPIARARAPIISTLSGGFTIPGGSKIVGLNANNTPYTRVLLAVAGATDYYELTGLPSDPYKTILFTVAQTAPLAFAVRIAVAAGPDDPIGPYQQISVNLTSVGTGDVQVSLAWDAFSDVDLHVVQPTGTEIYYGAKTDGVSKGTLDLDSNAGCGIDRKNNENVTWQGGTPPRGEYIVRVDNWDSCGQTRINYVVTVNVKGQQTQSFVGWFTDTGDRGGGGSGIEITRFTY